MQDHGGEKVAMPATDRSGRAKFAREFLDRYLPHVPVPLALERSIECGILSAHPFERPILDIGCGDGIFAAVLFSEPIETGIDPDPGELEIARRHGAYDELIECFGNEIPKEDCQHTRRCSRTASWNTSPMSTPVVHEVFRLLRPGGSFYVTIPTHRFERYTIGNLILSGLGAKRLAEKWRGVFKRFWNLYNVNQPKWWTDMFEGAGFVVEESFEYEPPSLYLLKEALMPFSVPGAVSKRVRDRWVILPAPLRKIATAPIVWLTRPLMARWARSNEGCLIFIALRKPL